MVRSTYALPRCGTDYLTTGFSKTLSKNSNLSFATQSSQTESFLRATQKLIDSTTLLFNLRMQVVQSAVPALLPRVSFQISGILSQQHKN